MMNKEERSKMINFSVKEIQSKGFPKKIGDSLDLDNTSIRPITLDETDVKKLKEIQQKNK